MADPSPLDATYDDWRRDPQGFWADAAREIAWINPYDRVIDTAHSPLARWFVGGTLNACYNAVDRHVEIGNGRRTALIYDSPMTGRKLRLTYEDLRAAVARAAGMLRARGVGRGDRVVIYMPMVPEAVISMLACARIGAIHSVVFGGFAARELAVRIDDATPRLVVSASCGIEPHRIVDYKQLLDDAMELAGHRPDCCIIVQRPEQPCALRRPRDVDWHEEMDRASPVDCVPVAATDPSYILYTSGTTGRPKGVVRDTGGHLVALKWSMTHVYGAQSNETFWAASDIGWVVGHSYIVYGPLLQGCATVLYEGKPIGTPDAGAFWRVVNEHHVRTLFTAPTAMRAIKREDPRAENLDRYDVSCLRALFLAGERADPATVAWAQAHLKVPVIDHWWQTETGWAIAANCLGLGLLPTKLGSVTKPAPGFNVRILDGRGAEVPAETSGTIALSLPLPPGCLSTLWNDDARCVSSYLSAFPGYYATGDGGKMDEAGYLYVMGRIDDVINVAGHRLSTGELEQVLAGHESVAECAVIGVADAVKGEVPLGLVVLKAGPHKAHEQITAELIATVRNEVGPVASFKECLIVERLPKTRSGKILRATMRLIADGLPYPPPATIEDPAVLWEISKVLHGRSTTIPHETSVSS